MSRAAAAAAMLLLLPSALAAPWLQEGGDAARTSATRDLGPQAADLAWRVELDGIRAPLGAALILDRAVYVPIFNGSNGEAGSVWRIPVDTAAPERFLSFDSHVQSLASDGDVLIVATDWNVTAHAHEDGAELWRYELPRLLPHIDQTECAAAAVLEGTAYLLCWQAQHGVQYYYLADAQSRVFAVALDVATGAERWLWLHGMDDDGLADLPLRPAQPDAPPVSAVLISGITASGPRVYAIVGQLVGTRGGSSLMLYALDRTTGELAWRQGHADNVELVQRTVDPEDFSGIPANFMPPPSIGDEGLVYSILGDVTAHEAVTGREAWRMQPSDSQAAEFSDVAAELALADGALFTATRSTLARIDLAARDFVWRQPLTGNESWGQGGMVVSGGIVYAMTARYNATAPDESHDALLAFDVATGAPRWRFDMGLQPTNRNIVPRVNAMLPPGCYLAASDGLIAAACSAGTVFLLGHTAASPVVLADASDLYPPVGAEVAVDLGGTRAGLRGPAEEYAADWGDGTRTEWQRDPVLRHAYREPGEKSARFFARNAEQSASTAVTLHVGASPPTLLETAFSAEFQDYTFFVLGLAITAIGGVFGIVRPRRRRARLRAAIRAVDDAYARTCHDPLVCERAMTLQRQDAREKLLVGALGEDQFTVVAAHIGERTGEARMSFLRSRYAFLPLGVTEQLRAMLADGTVTRLEHAHLVSAVGADATMTPEQKAQVRALLATWAERDA